MCRWPRVAVLVKSAGWHRAVWRQDMLDMIGAIAGTAVYAVIVGSLIGWSRARRPTKLKLLTAAGGWAALVVTLGAVGAFEPGAVGPIPAPVFASVAFLAL